MSENSLWCTHCGKVEVRPGMFCPSCGKEASSKAGAMPEEASVRIATDTKSIEEKAATFDGRDAGFKTAAIMSCEGDFRLEYNIARVFLKGQHSSFNFRIVPQMTQEAKSARDFTIETQFGFQSPASKMMAGLPDNHEVHVNFKPEVSGVDIPADVLFSYSLRGRKKRFESQFLWDCYPPDEPSARAIENLTIKIENSGHANDYDLLKNFKAKEQKSVADLLRDLKLHPVWKPLSLVPIDHECGGLEQELATLQDPPSAARVDRLSLSLGRQFVHLFSSESLQLGRNRQCDIVTRIFSPQGKATPEDNAHIGKFHCRIERTRDAVSVVDKGYYPDENKWKPSLCGTWLNEVRVTSGKSAPLTSGDTFRLNLGAAHDASPTRAFCMEGRVWTGGQLGSHNFCPSHHEMTGPWGMVLRRCDQIPEAFVIVWERCPLALASECFVPCCVYRRQNAFAYGIVCDGERHVGWLVPGKEIRLPSGTVTIAPYKQLNL